jgi:DNA (cytosine-5)-methyltransferase 1
VRPKVGSLFAGVEGFGQGLEAAGFEIAWQVEIDKDAVSVLERHYPNVPRVRDIREAGAHNLAPVDVITFGSPCQGFSVAGRGDGLEDARSGLFGEAIRIIRELRPAVAVWENVPGAFSANDGRDFGAVLAALADAGAVDIAWRVLDARWFGVPQRRRRIFLVADFGAERAAQVLFEPEGSRRDSAACRTAGEGAPGDAEDGAGVIGEPIAYQCHGNNVGAIGTLRQGNGGLTGGVPFVSQAVAAFGGNRTSGPLDVATACNAHGGPHGRLDFESETFVVANSVQASAGHHGHSSPRGDGSDNLIAFHLTQDPINGAESPALGAGNEAGCATVAVAISENQRSEVRETPYARQLTAGGGKPGQGYPSVREGMAVRRLTPREAERLMSFPDDWTRYRADGSELSDGARYRCIGNAVVSNVAEWIGRRLFRALEIAR